MNSRSASAEACLSQPSVALGVVPLGQTSMALADAAPAVVA